MDDLAQLLADTDMEAVLADLGKRTSGEDPVVHFYETFLAAYDPKLRESRGMYYTPEPVVSYLARSVDYLLNTRFGCANGLADTATVEYEVDPGAPVYDRHQGGPENEEPDVVEFGSAPGHDRREDSCRSQTGVKAVEFLKSDFPRVPLTSDVKLFRALCGLGEELVALHLLEFLKLVMPVACFPVKGSNQVDKGFPKYLARGEPEPFVKPTSRRQGRGGINPPLLRGTGLRQP